jgi:predicted nucleic acid-binding protein
LNRLVIDCSVTMAWCFEDECDPYADATLAAMASAEACVPSVWSLEVTNVLLVTERRGRIAPADSARFVQLLEDLPIVVDQDDRRRIHGPVLDLGRRTGLSVYDASYLDLAMRLGVPLATRDTALREAASANRVQLFDPAG